MAGSKYSNILTMFLVVLIVAILGIIGYFAYDMLNSKNINSNAETAIDEFEKSKLATKSHNSSDSSNEEENEVENNEVSDPLAALNDAMGNQVEEEETDEPQREVEKTYMEDYEVKGVIEIPRTGIKYPVLEKVTKRSLEIAVAIAYGPGLNEVGNTIIYGHNYRNGLFFSNNKKLSNGDPIYITDQIGNKVKYIIYNIYQTTPNDASYMTRDTAGRREISLQTCTDDSSGRIIVWAAEEGSM